MKCAFTALLSVLFFASVVRANTVNYRVGIGDVLEVIVLDEKEFTGQFRVGSDGTIDYPFVRKIDVKGKTVEEITRAVAEKLKDGYLSDPQINVNVKQFGSQKVLILGAVAKPGTYILEEETRILDLLSRAGGITDAGAKRVLLVRDKPESPSPTKAPDAPKPEGATGTPKPEGAVTVPKPDVAPIVIDYYRLMHKGDLSQNVLLADGDIINIPKANEIFVLGHVARPGPVKYEDNMGILQAVTLAGGPSLTASTRSTYVLRQTEKGEEKIQVRLDKILENKEKNVILKADDVVVVPESFF